MLAKRVIPLVARTTRTRLFSSFKEIRFGDEGRNAMGKGVNTLANAVAVTLGPKGRNVIIEQSYGPPKITKDGVTVAKSITLEDKFENLGARIVQDVANKTNEVAGDGTTTATVLARAIFVEGLKSIASGVNPMELRKGVQLAVNATVDFLKTNATAVTTPEQIKQVATISANGDEHIGSLIAEAMVKVTKEGVITVKDGKTMKDEMEVTEGMRFDRGYVSPYFITDAKAQKVEFESPLVLLSEKKISNVNDIIPALEIAASTRQPLLVIAEDIEGEALAAMILNKLRGQVQVCAVKAPGFGDNRKAILEDIAIITGSTIFNEELDVKLDKLSREQLGSAAGCTITKEDTTFINLKSNTHAVHQRCEALRVAIKDTTSEWEKEKLQERLAKLSGGVAVIKVGGVSEVEVNEKKDRFFDAINATKAAVEEGIIPGGGSALVKAVPILQALSAKEQNYDVKLGIQIVSKAIQAPLKTIVDNAGAEGAVVVGHILANTKEFAYGYNAATSEYVNMFEAGIVDPLKVVRTALTDASAIASLLSTSEAMIVDAPEKESSMPASQGMGGMGGMIKIIIFDIDTAPFPSNKNTIIEFIKVDLGNKSDLKLALQSLSETPNILIANAGKLCIERDLYSVDMEAFENVIDVNFLSHAIIIYHLLNEWKSKENKLQNYHLVTVASGLGLASLPYLASYCCSKASLMTLHESVCHQASIDNTINLSSTLLCPGKLDSKMFKDHRIKYEFLTPILSIEYLAKLIVQRIEWAQPNSHQTLWPGYYVYLIGILRFLPLKLSHLIQKILGSDKLAINSIKG